MKDTTEGVAAALPADASGGGSAGQERRAVIRVSALAAGTVVAGLGLGVSAILVLLLWIGSPFPGGGLGGALHFGSELWLLAQGAELVRTGTLSGDPAPVALTPLLLSALPAWLLYRGTASVVTAEETRDMREAARVVGWVLAGYLSAAAMAVACTATGPVHVQPLTGLYVALFAAVAAGCGAWSACGRPFGRLWGYAAEARAALRAAAVAAGTLLGGGALLGGAALAWHAGASGQTYAQLSTSIAGRFPVLLTAVALVPNLAVWAASYALGAGFAVGAGTVVGVTGASAPPVLPDFPLLAAVPGPGGAGVGWAALALPAVAGGLAARCAGREGRGKDGGGGGGKDKSGDKDGGGGGWRTVRVVTAAALLYGAALAVLAAWSGGPLGTGLLSDFGPSWWRAGALAGGWTLAVGLPGELLRRGVSGPSAPPWRTPVRNLPPAGSARAPGSVYAVGSAPSATPAPTAASVQMTPPEGPLTPQSPLVPPAPAHPHPHPHDPFPPSPEDDGVLLPPRHDPLPWPSLPPPLSPPRPPAPEHPGER